MGKDQSWPLAQCDKSEEFLGLKDMTSGSLLLTEEDENYKPTGCVK